MECFIPPESTALTLPLFPLVRDMHSYPKPRSANEAPQHAAAPSRLHSRIHHQPRRLSHSPLPPRLIPIPPLSRLLPHLQRHLPVRRLYLTFFDSIHSNTQPLSTISTPMRESWASDTAGIVRFHSHSMDRICHHILGGTSGWSCIYEYLR